MQSTGNGYISARCICRGFTEEVIDCASYVTGLTHPCHWWCGLKHRIQLGLLVCTELCHICPNEPW